MRQVKYTAPTKRRAMTKARATRIFLRENGRCYLCDNQVRDGEEWQIEHPEELWDGGSDRDEDLRVAHTECHKTKTADSQRKRNKRNELITKNWKDKPRKSPGFRGWRKFDGTPVWR